MKNCVICGIEFNPRRGNQKYCSKKCREKINGALNYIRHIDARRQYARDNKPRAKELEKTPKRRAQRAKHARDRRNSDPVYKIKINIIDRYRHDIFYKDQFSYTNVISGLPQSCNEILDWLLTTIPKGYTIQDYLDRKLEIDHIIPYSKYIILKIGDKEFKKCWDKRNLRFIARGENASRTKGTGSINFKEIQYLNIVELLPSGADVIFKNISNITP
jgi:hypothetical protein